MNYEEDKPISYCGIFGIYGSDRASAQTYYGLHALQHRGQEASGIVTRSINGDNKPHFNIVKGEGLVSEVFADHSILSDVLKGNSAIGHNRYSTTGAAKLPVYGLRRTPPAFWHFYRLAQLTLSRGAANGCPGQTALLCNERS